MLLSWLSVGSSVLLTQVQLPSAARDFLPESIFCTDCFTVFVQPSCSCLCCVYVKIPKIMTKSN